MSEVAEQLNTNTQLFELQPGKNLDLQISHPVSVRLKLTLVGYELGKYIILKYPRVANPSDYKDVLVEGNVVIVRYLLEGSKGECFAFRSSIKSVCQYPERFIFLAYPEKIENRQLRRQQRNTIYLPASIMIEDSTQAQESQLSGVIVDISEKGCGFTFKSQSTSTTVNKRNIIVKVQTHGKQEFKIAAKVCNSRNEKGNVSVGIQFLENQPQISELLGQLFILN